MLSEILIDLIKVFVGLFGVIKLSYLPFILIGYLRAVNRIFDRICNSPRKVDGLGSVSFVK